MFFSDMLPKYLWEMLLELPGLTLLQIFCAFVRGRIYAMLGANASLPQSCAAAIRHGSVEDLTQSLEYALQIS